MSYTNKTLTLQRKLPEHDFKAIYILGTSVGNVDALSRILSGDHEDIELDICVAATRS